MKLTPALRAEIRRLHTVESWPVGTIASHLGLHHGVVRRGLKDAPPERQPRPNAIEPYLPTIRQLLERYPSLTATRIHFTIRDLGFTCGVAQVRRAIVQHGLRPERARRAYSEIVALPGQEAQVDWARVGTLTIGNAQRPVWALLVVLSYSRDCWVGFYHDMGLANVLDCHVKAFTHFGGVPRRVLYDNMKTVVLDRVDDAIRFQPDFLTCAAHYGFEPVACRPYRPNEKGRVERRVRDLRSSMLAGNEYGSLADYERAFRRWRADVLLERTLTRYPPMTVGEALVEDTERLLRLPMHPLRVEIRHSTTVRKTPWIAVDANRYSVPPSAVGKAISVVATHDRVIVRLGETQIAEHIRCWDKGKRIDDPEHIRALAVTNRRSDVRAHDSQRRLLDAVPAAKMLFTELASRQEPLRTHARALLLLLDRYGADALGDAIAVALQRNTPLASSVEWILRRSNPASHDDAPRPEVTISPLAEAATPHFNLQPLEDYDAIHDQPSTR